MLILAGVSLNGVFGENGLINKAQKAKEDSEVAEEMELIGRASIKALANSRNGIITVVEMENALRNLNSENNTTVMKNDVTIVVKFNDSNRHYEIDKNGNTEGPKEAIGDKYAGDPTKGGQNLGTEEKPYMINCIEDLVVFSRDYIKYESSYVILARTLDFKSLFSYNDCTSKEYGDLNGDGTVDDIKTELTKQGDNCCGFTPIASFKGTFDGQNNKICNLYENRGENNTGVFLKISNASTIKNLGIVNVNLKGANNIAGLVADADYNCKVEKCYIDGRITIENTTEGGYIGLIIGKGTHISVQDCYSQGNLDLKATKMNFAGIIRKCFRCKHYNT